MDPPGILMLQSVRNVFEKLGLQPENIKFKKEEFVSSNMVKALTENPKKCPAIAADRWIAKENKRKEIAGEKMLENGMAAMLWLRQMHCKENDLLINQS